MEAGREDKMPFVDDTKTLQNLHVGIGHGLPFCPKDCEGADLGYPYDPMIEGSECNGNFYGGL
jgi:hypothetical protein